MCSSRTRCYAIQEHSHCQWHRGQGDDPAAASAVDRASAGEEPQISLVELQVGLSTDDSEELKEPAATSSICSTLITFNAPAAMSSSTVEVVGPSTLPQHTPSVSMPALTPRRLVRHSRTVPRSADQRGHGSFVQEEC